jgi:adenylate kinase family enzyme
MRQPLLVFVSGTPGAGKTTLAHAIAEYLRIPHVPRDEVLRGMEMTAGAPINRGSEGIATYYLILNTMLDAGVSLVTDGTIYKELSEKDIKTHLSSRATVINVHARAQNEQERFIQREKRREGWSSEWVEAHKARLAEIYHETVEPLELDVPLIEVNTTHGYGPPIEEIVQRIREIYQDTRSGILSPVQKTE